MKTFINTSGGLLILILFLAGCKGNNDNKSTFRIALEDESATTVTKVRQIFYNVCLPTEISKIFEKTGSNYNPDILNSADNLTRYTTPNEIALNLGIYGVDMSYTRIFGQTSATAKYFSTVRMMSEKLGIPDSYYEDLFNHLEEYKDNKDSLTRLAGEIYERSEKFLRENNQDAKAALIITGGWIEALYIASRIAEQNPDNVEITNRIAEQKYSLNTLISLLNNYQDDISITENILMLKRLKNSFDKYEIFFNQKSFSVDSVNDLISSSDYVTDITPEIISEINSVISTIRMSIVN